MACPVASFQFSWVIAISAGEDVSKNLYENKFHKWFGSGKRSAPDPNPVVLFGTRRRGRIGPVSTAVAFRCVSDDKGICCC
jgi:hypothetical protein